MASVGLFVGALALLDQLLYPVKTRRSAVVTRAHLFARQRGDSHSNNRMCDRPRAFAVCLKNHGRVMMTAGGEDFINLPRVSGIGRVFS
jgi:hypothetical protein